MGGGSPIFVWATGKAYTNGAESDGVALAGGTSGSPAVLDTDVLLQVRVGVEETNGKNGDFRADWQFQYNGGAWTDLTLSSSPVKTTPSQNILNDTNTTNRLGNTPFQAGDYQDDGFSRQHSGINGEFIEFLTTIIIDSGAVTDGFSLNFRVLNGSADPDPTGTNWLYCEVNIPTRTLPGEVANGQSYVNVETIGSRWGPFVDTNGNIYVMSEGGWNQNWDTGKPPIVVHKSADGGKLWTPLGFKEFFDNGGDGDPEGMHLWADPSTTGLWHEFHMETGDDAYRNRWRTSDFSGSPDTWDTANLSELIQDGADSLNVNLATMSGMARQDGDLIAVYPNEALASSLDRLYWRWHNGTAWQDTSPGNVLESNASVEYTQPIMGQGLSSRAIVVYKDHTNDNIYFRYATSANPPVWQSRQQLNTNSRTVKNALRAPIVSVVRYDDTNDYHAVIWLDNSDDLWLNTIKWNGSSYDIGTTPVQINTVTVESNWPGPSETEDLDNQGPNAGAAADAAEGFVYIMYADATNRDVYRNYWSEGGGVGTETLTVDVSTAHSAGGCTYVAPVVFTHASGNGGAKVVGFVYELNVGNATPPGRGAYYNEFTPESGGEAVALDGSANAAADAPATLVARCAIDGSADAAADSPAALGRARGVASSADAAADSSTALVRQRGLASSADAASEVAGVLDVARGLQGSADAAAESSATLTSQINLPSSSNAAADASATMGVRSGLASSSDVAADSTAQLVRLREIDSSANAASASSAALTRATPVAAVAEAAADSSTALDLEVALVGSANAAADAPASLDVEGLAQLDGSADVAAEASSTLTRGRSVASSANAAADSSAALIVGAAISLDGSANAASATSSQIDVAFDLDAVGEAAADSVASADRLRGVAGSANAASAGTVDLDRARGLSATGNAAADTSATLDVGADVSLDGVGEVAADSSATLDLDISLVATGSVAAESVGAIDRQRGLASTANAAADSSATSDLARGLAGSANAAADAPATLDVGADVTLDGSANTAVDASAVLGRQVDLAAVADAAVDASALVNPLRGVTGSANAASDAPADVDRARGLSSSGNAATDASATLDVGAEASVAGSANAAADSSASLSVTSSFTGSAPAAADSSGVAVRLIVVSGTGATAVDGTAQMVRLRAVSGVGEAANTASGQLLTLLDGSASAAVLAAATMEVVRGLAGVGEVANAVVADADLLVGLAASGNAAADAAITALTIVDTAAEITDIDLVRTYDVAERTYSPGDRTYVETL